MKHLWWRRWTSNLFISVYGSIADTQQQLAAYVPGCTICGIKVMVAVSENKTEAQRVQRFLGLCFLEAYLKKQSSSLSCKQLQRVLDQTPPNGTAHNYHPCALQDALRLQLVAANTTNAHTTAAKRLTGRNST